MKKSLNKYHTFSVASILCSLVLLILISLSAVSPAFAAGAVLLVSPGNGSFSVGTPVTVSVIIDGHGDTFNAAKATVVVSSSFVVSDITLGDCNFAFVTTPAITNPSFSGVILGGSSTKCTVYTLTLLPVSTGTGTVTFSNAQVKAYKIAADTLSAVQNGNYTITPATNGATSISVPPQATDTQQNTTSDISNQNAPYTITIKALGGDGSPLAGATVILDPQQSTQFVQTVNQSTPSITAFPTLTAVTDSKGVAHFPNVPTGVHTVTVRNNNTQLAKTILNVNGTNHALVLGVKAQQQPLNFFFISIVIMVIAALLALFFLMTRYMPLLKKVQLKKEEKKGN